MAKSDSNLPAWVWLFTGVITGLFLAFLYYLAGIKPTDKQMQAIEVSNPLPGKGKSSPKFDFYTLLPDREVVAPPSTQTPKTGSTTPVPAPGKDEQFMIQTGSFRSAQEADHRRAELILLGLDAKIQKVELGPGEAWHRVQVGPFASASELDKAKTALANNHIEHIVLRLKK